MAETAIHQETIKLAADAQIELFELDMRKLGGERLYFTTQGDMGQRVRFGITDFYCVAVEFTGMTVSGTGPLQTPMLTVGNTDGFIQEILNSFGNLEGCTLTRWRTFGRFLANGDTPDPTAFYGPDVYVIDRKASDTPEQVQWELSAMIDSQGIYIGRTIIRDTCMWRYREYNQQTGTFDYSKAQCPYTGNRYFDQNNEPVPTAAQDQPARNVECCRRRFGFGLNGFPFGGFPGIVRGI